MERELGEGYCLAPSILSADFARLGEEVERVVEAGCEVVHVDVMDNHYVPNLTIGPLVCAAIRPRTRAIIDVHLMVRPVDALVPLFAKAGADIVSFHPEASEHPDRTLALIREQGCRAGLALNPATPLAHLDHVMDRLDLILVMSVNPGFGGQSFIPSAFEKIAEVRRRIDRHRERTGHLIRLEVDGGIKPDNIRAVAEAGADIFVAGSAIFGAADSDGGYRGVVGRMRAALMAEPEWRAA
ncbi:ribulose-phosphate 3-epimerase [Azospirillum largimobile]